MNKPAQKRKSLRVIIASNFIVLAITVFSLGAVILYAGVENSKSLRTQSILGAKYDTAIDLKAAIDSLAYYSTEMSNSLTDDSLDNFEDASQLAEDLINDVVDMQFKKILRTHKTSIEQNALAALDAYVVDDRSTGRAHMAKVRDSVAKLKSVMEAHVVSYRSMRQLETEAIRQRTVLVARIATIMAGIALLVLLLSAFLMWRTLFAPIRTLIGSITCAANDATHAVNFRVSNLPENEVGAAGHALNLLLDEVSSAIAEAHKRAEEAQHAEKKWQALFDGSPDAIVVLDPKTGKILDHNPSTRNLLCMTRENETVVKNMTGFDIHHHELDTFHSFLDQIQSDGFARSDNLSCAIDAKRIPVSVVGVTVSHNCTAAVLLHIRDISKQREHEAELDAARIQAERANDAKSNFLANMSHEIRTPMNGVLGIAEVLQATKLDEQQRELTSIIVSSGVALLHVINDILDFSKVEAGKLELQPGRFDLHDLVVDVISLMRARSISKGIELQLNITDETPRDVYGDAPRFRQILTNIVGNAVKFTELGYVRVDVSGILRDGVVDLEVKVEDTGIGIPQSDIDRVFEKFEQVDTSKARRFEGTGLGLAISKSLIELMGGQIAARSVLGEGSTFVLTLPLSAANLNELTPDHVPTLDEARLLVIDGDTENQHQLSECFDHWHIRYHFASSADEAYEALENSADECNRFHLLLINTQNRKACLNTLSIRMKNDTRFASIPIATLPWEGECREKLASNEEMVVDFPIKSTLTKELSHILASSLRKPKNDQFEALSPHDISVSVECESKKQDLEINRLQVCKKPKVLIAEDNIVNQQVLQMMIGEEYDVEIAENGRVAIDKHINFKPDIVFMDLSMPVMNGYEAAERIRQNEKELDLDPTPIIAATAHAHTDDHKKCLDAGMDDVITKPMRKPDIEAVLRKWLQAYSEKTGEHFDERRVS